MSDRARRVAAVTVIATALAVPADGLRLRYLASLAVADKVNKRFGHPCNYAKRVRGNALMQKLANVCNLLCRKFVRWLLLSVEVYKARLPSMLGISCQANPLKVLSPVVGLYTVDVVDAQPRLVAINESRRDKAMHKESGAFSIDAKANFTVSRVVWLRRVLLRLSGAADGLRFSVANPLINVRSGRQSNSADVANFKRDAAFFNGFPLFHTKTSCCDSVYIIGGLK